VPVRKLTQKEYDSGSLKVIEYSKRNDHTLKKKKKKELEEGTTWHFEGF